MIADCPHPAQLPSWAEYAVRLYRAEQHLADAARLTQAAAKRQSYTKRLLNELTRFKIPTDPQTIWYEQDVPYISIDGVQFSVTPSGDLVVVRSCPRCAQPSEGRPITSLQDLGESLTDWQPGDAHLLACQSSRPTTLPLPLTVGSRVFLRAQTGPCQFGILDAMNAQGIRIVPVPETPGGDGPDWETRLPERFYPWSNVSYLEDAS